MAAGGLCRPPLCTRQGLGLASGAPMRDAVHDTWHAGRSSAMTQDVITSATKEVAAKDSDVRVERSAVGVLRGRDVEVGMAGVGMVLADRNVAVTQGGGRTFVARGNVSIQQGGGGTLVAAGDATIRQGGAGSLLTLGAVSVEQGGIGMALAREVRAG